MRRHDVVRHLDHEHLAAGAAIASFGELIAPHVADKVGIVKSFSGNLGSAAEEILLAGIAVRETVVAIKNKIDVVVEIQDGWRVGHRQKTYRFVALAVEMLIPGVQWRRKKRAFAPFEALALPALLPNRRRAAAADNVNQTFEQMLLRLKRLAGRNFADITIIDALGALEIEINPSATDACPWVEFNCGDIFHMKSAHRRNRFFFNKDLIGSFCPELVARSLEICPNHLASLPKNANDR